MQWHLPTGAMKSPLVCAVSVAWNRANSETKRQDSLKHFSKTNQPQPQMLEPEKIQPFLQDGSHKQTLTPVDLPLQGKLAQLLPVDMQSRKHQLSCTESTLGCTVTVHDAQSLHTTSETQVKLECSARQLAAVEQVFLAVYTCSAAIKWTPWSALTQLWRSWARVWRQKE
jgi:hypothetical protein